MTGQCAPIAPLLTPDQAATRLGLTVDVLTELRRVGRGPDHLEIDDDTVRYSPAALVSWRKLTDHDAGLGERQRDSRTSENSG